MGDDGEWLPVAAAANKLGVTQQAIRHRIRRGTIERRRNNRGQTLVKAIPADHPPQIEQSLDTSRVADSADYPVELRTIQEASVPLSLMRELITAAETRAVAVRRDADAEIARLCEQFRAERSFWTERADAAECRAEATERLLFEALTTLERAIRPPEPLSIKEWLFGRGTK